MELAFRASMRASEEGTRINEPICGKYSLRPSGLRKGALASSQLLPLAMREAPRVDAVRPQRAKARTVVSCPVVPTRLGATAPAPRPLQGRPRPAAVGQ